MDFAILKEMREIANYITSMKREIGTLQVNDIKNAHIPAAGVELDAIVKATETATNSIMECAEAVMGADASDAKAYKAMVDDRMMVVFEACSFQDITGQRIAKVVETLQYIEARVSRFAAAVTVADVVAPLSAEEARRADRRAKLLLHGPQAASVAIKQTEVDALLGEAKLAAPKPQPHAAKPGEAKPAVAKPAAAKPPAAKPPAAKPVAQAEPAKPQRAAAQPGNSQSEIDALFP
ncbi:MAG: protein phosphatase CheZ [Variibacter sp.]|nr:protein phosphatase CheZ [Variibacter sp.]